jgi:hypothetical protein
MIMPTSKEGTKQTFRAWILKNLQMTYTDYMRRHKSEERKALYAKYQKGGH